MQGDQIINLVAVVGSLTAVIISSFLTWQALRLSRNANHVPVLIDVFGEHRSSDFIEMEQRVWNEMANHDVKLGFSGLPTDFKPVVTSVTLFYLMLAYFSEYEVADQEMVAVQVQYRVIKTWQAIEGHVREERLIRGGDFTFLNTLEIFVERASGLDTEAIAHRMRSRLREQQRSSRNKYLRAPPQSTQ